MILRPGVRLQCHQGHPSHVVCPGTLVFVLFLYISVLLQSRFLDDGSLTKLCQIVFGDLPKCASKGEQLSDCCVTVLKHFMIFSNAISKEGF